MLDGPASRVWPQAANRLHAARRGAGPGLVTRSVTMRSPKTQRQHRIAKLLEGSGSRSQAQLVELLAADGRGRHPGHA